MFKCEVDTKNWGKAMGEYMKFCKKAPSEIVNTKAYFIMRNATLTTRSTTPEKIKMELNSPSSKYADVPLGAILVNSNLGKKGQPGLNGSKMAKAVEKLYNIKKRSINFVRAGWLKGIKEIQNFYQNGDVRFSRKYQPKMATGLKTSPRHKGGARYAIPNQTYTYAEIRNALETKKGGSILDHVLEVGLKAAIEKELQSMLVYIHNKFNAEHDKINK